MKQTFFLFALLIFTARAVTDLPAGSAKRSLTYDGATAELTFTAAFVDQKDERKPIVSATGFDQLCATFRTAISSASDKTEQIDPTADSGNKLISKRRRLGGGIFR